jgi:hypothetical protein
MDRKLSLFFWKIFDFCKRYITAVDILAAVKRTAIPHHATFLEWSLNGVDASRDAATLAVVLRFPLRPFKVSECPPATLIFTAAFTSRS